MIRKDVNDGDMTISFGSLSQMFGAADQKAWVPIMVFVTGTASRREMSVTSTFRSERLMICLLLDPGREISRLSFGDELVCRHRNLEIYPPLGW